MKNPTTYNSVIGNRTARRKCKEMVRAMYKTDDGHPFELTDTQADIFNLIFKRKYHRGRVATPTQYGKSDVIAMAVLTRAATFAEKWCIVAGTKDQAGIIMSYVIKHAFENDFTRAKIHLKTGESLQRLQDEKSKDKITLKHTDGTRSEIMVLGASGSRVDPVEAGRSVMGFGAANIIEDEAALVKDAVNAKIMRMLGGHKDNFICKVGNPWRRNHFYRSLKDPAFVQIWVDWKQALAEGRYTREYIDEMRNEMFFDILYEVKDPDAEMVDADGWIPLLTEDQIEQAQVRADGLHTKGVKRAGFDIGEGGDENVCVVRTENLAWIRHSDKQRDPTVTKETFEDILDDDGINAENCFVDGIYDNGVGSMMRSDGYDVESVKHSEEADNKEKYYNRRSENYIRLRDWVLAGGALQRDTKWKQLSLIKFQVVGGKKIQIMPKQKLIRAGYRSPNDADALAYTFTDNEPHNRARPKKKLRPAGGHMAV